MANLNKKGRPKDKNECIDYTTLFWYRLWSLFIVGTGACVIFMETIPKRYAWLPYEEQALFLLAYLGVALFALGLFEMAVCFWYGE